MMNIDDCNMVTSTVASSSNDDYDGTDSGPPGSVSGSSFNDYHHAVIYYGCLYSMDVNFDYIIPLPSESDFCPHSFFRKRQDNLIRIQLKQRFPVRSFLYHRQMLFPKSGFLGRAGKRRKN